MAKEVVKSLDTILMFQKYHALSDDWRTFKQLREFVATNTSGSISEGLLSNIVSQLSRMGYIEREKADGASHYLQYRAVREKFYSKGPEEIYKEVKEFSDVHRSAKPRRRTCKKKIVKTKLSKTMARRSKKTTTEEVVELLQGLPNDKFFNVNDLSRTRKKFKRGTVSPILGYLDKLGYVEKRKYTTLKGHGFEYRHLPVLKQKTVHVVAQEVLAFKAGNSSSQKKYSKKKTTKPASPKRQKRETKIKDMIIREVVKKLQGLPAGKWFDAKKLQRKFENQFKLGTISPVLSYLYKLDYVERAKKIGKRGFKYRVSVALKRGDALVITKKMLEAKNGKSFSNGQKEKIVLETTRVKSKVEKISILSSDNPFVRKIQEIDKQMKALSAQKEALEAAVARFEKDRRLLVE